MYITEFIYLWKLYFFQNKKNEPKTAKSAPPVNLKTLMRRELLKFENC